MARCRSFLGSAYEVDPNTNLVAEAVACIIELVVQAHDVVVALKAGQRRLDVDGLRWRNRACDRFLLTHRVTSPGSAWNCPTRSADSRRRLRSCSACPAACSDIPGSCTNVPRYGAARSRDG